MVVCKYFQQGSCRFGQSCRFEHIYGSKYSYNAAASASSAPSTQAGITDEQLVTQVQSDIQAAIKGKQWMLSVYAPFKEKPIYPGLSDLSPEEARLFIYEAKANNTLPQAAAFFSTLMQEANAKYEELLHPTPELIKKLRNLYKGNSAHASFSNAQQTNSGFGSANSGSTAASSIFRGAAQSNSIFGSASNTQPSVFGAQPGVNVFNTANPEHTAAKSIFAQANQNVFNTQQTSNATSIFASANKSIFGQNTPFGQTQAAPFINPTTQQSNNVFQKQDAPNQDVFSQSTTFGQTNASNPENFFGQKPAQTSANIFGQSTPSDMFRQATTQSVFGQASPNVEQQQQVAGIDRGVYNRLEDLSSEDIEAFQNSDFKLGFIPETPPPQALCV